MRETAGACKFVPAGRKLLTVLLAVVVIFTFFTGMSSGKEQKQYLKAVTTMDNGDYLEAIEEFEALNGYRDSEDMIKECYYLYAGQLFDQGKIKSASVIYRDLSGYRDADKRIQMCSDASTYEDALDSYNKENYMSAYLTLGTMSGKYKDSKSLEADCVCRIARQYYEKKEYEEAYDWYLILKECKDNLPKGTDTAFTKKIQIRYAESLINTKKDGSIKDGLKILKAMKSTDEIKKLISKGEKQLKQNQYDIAAGYLKKGQYTLAVDAFAKIKDYSDAKKQWLASMYGFVEENKYLYDDSKKSALSLRFADFYEETFYEYAKTLSKNNYKDSKAYYKKLTAWEVEIVMNGDVDGVTSATCVSKYDNVYAHLKLSGGPLNGKTQLKAVFTLPDGGKVNVKWKEKWKDGDSGYAYCYYKNPSKGKTGTCKVKIYDGNGTVIGSSQIKMVG